MKNQRFYFQGDQKVFSLTRFIANIYIGNAKLDKKLQKCTDHRSVYCTVNVDFLRIEYMVLAKYQHMSILELILLVKQHILILCKNLLGVDVLIIVN